MGEFLKSTTAVIARLAVHVITFIAIAVAIVELLHFKADGTALLLVIASYIGLRAVLWGLRGSGPMGFVEGGVLLAISLGLIVAPSFLPDRERMEREAAYRDTLDALMLEEQLGKNQRERQPVGSR